MPCRMAATPSAWASASSPVSSALAGQQRLGEGARARAARRRRLAAHRPGARSAEAAIGAAAAAAPAACGLHGDSRNSRTHLDLVGVHQRRRVADAGEFVQLRARAALRHGLRGVGRQQVGLRAAQQQRRAAQAVVGLPQHGLAGRGQLGRDGAEGHGDAPGRTRVVKPSTPSRVAGLSCGAVSASHCSRLCGPKPCESAHSGVGRLVQRAPEAAAGRGSCRCAAARRPRSPGRRR